MQRGLAEKRDRLVRLQAAQRSAALAGDRPRAAKLGVRADRVEAEIRREGQRLAEAQRLGPGGLRPRDRAAAERRLSAERVAFLDAQAGLPGSLRRPATDGARRDYPRLAPLLGLDADAYERLGPGQQRAARLAIDRELTLRRQPHEKVIESRPAVTPRHSSTDRAPHVDASRAGTTRHRPRETPSAGSAARESSVMRDAREVAAGRKRQLGHNLP